MKFTYEKAEFAIAICDTAPPVIHYLKLEGGDFEIIASAQGVQFRGTTQLFQPEDGECHLPVDDFREFMARLASAFDLAWKEQQKQKKESQARQAILGGM